MLYYILAPQTRHISHRNEWGIASVFAPKNNFSGKLHFWYASSCEFKWDIFIWMCLVLFQRGTNLNGLQLCWKEWVSIWVIWERKGYLLCLWWITKRVCKIRMGFSRMETAWRYEIGGVTEMNLQFFIALSWWVVCSFGLHTHALAHPSLHFCQGLEGCRGRHPSQWQQWWERGWPQSRGSGCHRLAEGNCWGRDNSLSHKWIRGSSGPYPRPAPPAGPKMHPGKKRKMGV